MLISTVLITFLRQGMPCLPEEGWWNQSARWGRNWHWVISRHPLAGIPPSWIMECEGGEDVKNWGWACEVTNFIKKHKNEKRIGLGYCTEMSSSLLKPVLSTISSRLIPFLSKFRAIIIFSSRIPSWRPLSCKHCAIFTITSWCLSACSLYCWTICSKLGESSAMNR